MDNHTQSSANTDPQLLLESGPMLIRDFNPKGVLYWTGRKCITCNQEILDHWLRNDRSGAYYCTETGPKESDGITDCVFDVSTIAKMPVCKHTKMAPESDHCATCGISRRAMMLGAPDDFGVY